jgi:hypothetical protein
MPSYPPAPQVRILPSIDFRGGLNLRSDAFQLDESESPDLLNVDLDPRGGFAMRRALLPINQSAVPFSTRLHSIFTYATSGGTNQVLVGSGKHTYYSTGTSFTSIGTTWTTTDPQRATVFNDVLYIQNGTDVPREWNGTVVGNLVDPAVGPTWNSDFDAPNDGDMPIAKCIVSHLGSVWVANTYENGTRYRSRVRWSHPNKPEDWRENDSIDVDTGHDGDEITALVPLGDRLLVFKRHSLHVIVGYDKDTFQVYPLSQTVGAVSQEAVAAVEGAVYWFDWPNGAFRYDGGEIEWLFERLMPAIWEGDIPAAYQSKVTCGVLGRRVYVSVPWGDSTDNARTFVFDPTLAKEGAWTFYGHGLGPMVEWHPQGAQHYPLACAVGDDYRVMRVDVDADADTWYTRYLDHVSGGVATAPDSAATSIVGDLDVRALLACDDWTPSSYEVIASKWLTTGNQRSWRFCNDSTGGLRLEWSADGTAEISKVSTAGMSLTDGAPKWVRVTLDVDNGAAGNDVKFYSSDDGTTWTQLGATVTTAGVTSIFNSTAGTYVGTSQAASRPLSAAKIYYVEVRNGIGGTVVANPDFTKHAAATTSFADDFSNTWTLTTDTFEAPDTDIESYYMTRWYDAGSVSQIKRWRRPDIVIDSDHDATIAVEAFRDYDNSSVATTFQYDATAHSGAVWGAVTWGSFTWSGSTSGHQQIHRGASLGRARAVQLKFSGPSTSKRWAVNAINFKYIPRRVR